MPSYAPILSALISGVGLAKIIAEHHLSAEDLRDLLNTPGMPDRLIAARALARLDDEFRTLAARARATDHLLHLIDSSDDSPEQRVESRRAATAILKGPLAIPRAAPGPVNPDRKGGASPRSDISDWSIPLDEDDADLDEGLDNAESAQCHPRPAASAGRDVRGSARTERGEREPAPKPAEPPKLPDEPTPDELVAHQLALIQSIDKPVATPMDIVHAIDFHNLAFPNRYYASKADAFQQNLVNNPILEAPGAQLTAEPAIIHDTQPPTATVRVTIRRPASPQAGSADAQCPMPDASCLFHLIHESMFFPDPKSPHAWHTQAITRDTG